MGPLIALSVLVGVPTMQPNSDAVPSATPVLTVCQVLDNLDRWRGQKIAIVALSEYTIEGTFLKGECGREIEIQGHRWPSMIAVKWNDDIRNRTPFPVQDSALRDKQRELGPIGANRTTSIRGAPSDASDSQLTPRTTIRFGPEWIAVFGCIDSPARLRPPTAMPSVSRSGNGYGANGSVPARISVTAYKALDGDPR